MSELSDFAMATEEQIKAARTGRTVFRSKVVCVCGHSEGSHVGRKAGLANGTFFEQCRSGRTNCECKKFNGVIEASTVLPFRAKPGKGGNAHPLMQGIQRLLSEDSEATIRKLDGWKCAAPDCNSTGQLTPLYLEVTPDGAHPVNKDTGTTVLVCALHIGGA